MNKVRTLIIVIIVSFMLYFAIPVITELGGSNPVEVSDRNENLKISSLDNSKVIIDNDYIYISQGMTQNDLLGLIGVESDESVQFSVTTSSQSEKTMDEISEFDRLYVYIEGTAEVEYYIINYIK